MDNAALTALVDLWRPETHSFHLPCGEMTITLEDAAMLFGLRVDGNNGHAVTSYINPQDWRDIVEAWLGVRLDEPQEGVKDRKITGVNSSWLVQHFGHHPPPHANALQIQMHARAWLWRMVGGFLFPDSRGNTISWMWIPMIGQAWDGIASYSWASATLAWLYQQMCDACRRSGPNANRGGCAYLL
jgi:hypothetical protein